jgi:uncharacterized protein with NAD-binding domain and iron-sulfur cluster
VNASASEFTPLRALIATQDSSGPIRVAVVGGGCASVAAAFELTRPQHKGKYHVTIYQLGWRLGGKGASGRGPADRIQEHGLHLWMGFYENAFRLLRECYAELNRDPAICRFADWRDAFVPEPLIGVTDRSPDGEWHKWMAFFPPGDGFPGDPLTHHNPFSVSSYLARTTTLLQTLLTTFEANRSDAGYDSAPLADDLSFGRGSFDNVSRYIQRLLKYGVVATANGLSQAIKLLAIVLPASSDYPGNIVLRLAENIASNIRERFEPLIESDPDARRLWQIIDLMLAFQTGVLRFGLLNDPRGFDALNDYDTREWLRINGASETSVHSSLMRGLYDLAMAYEDGDFRQPRMAAGLGLRGCLRMFFTYRGAMLWKMRAGMGDVVFAPFYEVLKRRGVTFKFFHRLENVKLIDPAALKPNERPYVESLEFDVQALVRNNDEYQPLVDVRGLNCWPAEPDYAQLVEGEGLKLEEWDFESHWDRRRVGTMSLQVVEDFDFVVLGVGLGAIPHVCRELIARDRRWRDMVNRVKTVPTQAFQVWMNEDMEELGWNAPPTTMSGFTQPFDTWADMSHLIHEESWTPGRVRSIAYFCCALPDTGTTVSRADFDYPKRRSREVRQNGIRFLNCEVRHLFPNAERRRGEFRWELLVDPFEQGTDVGPCQPSDASRFNSQFWTANVNPSDRYVLSLPGSIRYRISPLDNTYDNLTIAGDWTECALNLGCVESAVISGRLAAHAIASLPPLEEIIGYDHP